MEKKLYSLRNGLKKARKLKGITTQQELADKMNVTLKTVMNWEQGKVNPDLETMMMLCDELDCDLDYLTGRLPESTHDIHFVHEMTGLSEPAIKKLISLKETGFDDLISSILTDKDLDKLLSALQIDIDEAEMWWNGLLENTAMIDSLNGHRDVADYIASQSFIKVMNNQRAQFEKINGRLYDRMVPVMLEKDRIDAVISLYHWCNTDEEAREYLRENYSVTKTNRAISKEEHEEIIRIWHDSNYDELKRMSYSEWRRKYGQN